ncbi:MAG: phosphoribosylanthranilate isomerase [Oscillospiraceae bacterium]|jgi:phosphoribosylanthranilate isomerase|nr:phosphoribosylanthranilate isomerase [Oscillospiraceae bacterium]
MNTPKIKICGLFRQEDAFAVNQAKPDYAGFVFFEKSRRNVSCEQAKTLRGAIDKRIASVGVFVNAPREQIANLYHQNIISTVQLHGSEDEAYIAELRKTLPGVSIWKAFRIRTKEDLLAAAQSMADEVLLDNGYGTGKCFDWSLIQTIARPFILAGGLTPENLHEAIARFHPSAVDISSGVETNGCKDAEKILAAVRAVRISGR